MKRLAIEFIKLWYKYCRLHFKYQMEKEKVRRLERTIVNTNWVDKLLQDSYLKFTEDLEKERKKDFNLIQQHG
jgi:hypothetical protein